MAERHPFVVQVSLLSMAENEKRKKIVVTAALAVVALVLLAILAVVFLPLKVVSADVSQGTGGQEGTDTVVIDLAMNIGELEVRFAPLDGPALTMHTTMKARVGVMDPVDVLRTTLTSSVQGKKCLVLARANVQENILFNSDIQIKNVIEIDPKYNTSLSIVMNTGSVRFDTTGAGTIDNITMDVDVGSISMGLGDGVSVNGDMDIQTDVGSVKVVCGNLTFLESARNIRTTANTGSVEVTCDLSSKLPDQVLWDIGTKTGSVELDLRISDRLAAEVVADTNVGSVSVPDHHNFQVIQQNEGYAKYQSMNYATEDGIIFQVQVTGVGSIEAHLSQV